MYVVIQILFFNFPLLSLQMKVLSKSIMLQLEIGASLFCNDKLISQPIYDACNACFESVRKCFVVGIIMQKVKDR